MKTLLILISIAASQTLVLAQQTSPQDPYWVEYQLTESVRKNPRAPWIVRYSAPSGMGARMGVTLGMVLRNFNATSELDNNCYDFTFAAKTLNADATLLDQELTVTEYRGDFGCDAIDPTQNLVLTKKSLKVSQGEKTTLELPFFGKEEIKIELSQKWRANP